MPSTRPHFLQLNEGRGALPILGPFCGWNGPSQVGAFLLRVLAVLCVVGLEQREGEAAGPGRELLTQGPALQGRMALIVPLHGWTADQRLLLTPGGERRLLCYPDAPSSRREQGHTQSGQILSSAHPAPRRPPDPSPESPSLVLESSVLPVSALTGTRVRNCPIPCSGQGW